MFLYKSALRMSVFDLVAEIFAVTLLGISGLDGINYNVPPFLYAVNNILIPMLGQFRH